MVKKAAKLTADGYDDGANQLTRYFQATWRQRAIQIHSTLPDDQKHKAGQMAYDELKAEFEMETKKGATLSMYQDEFGNFRSPNAMNAEEAKENAAAIDQARIKEREMIGRYGVSGLSSPRLFFSEQELINIQNDSADRGVLAIPEKAKRIAKQFDGINAIDVINLQRESLGMEPLSSNALEAFDQVNTLVLLLLTAIFGALFLDIWSADTSVLKGLLGLGWTALLLIGLFFSEKHEKN